MMVLKRRRKRRKVRVRKRTKKTGGAQVEAKVQRKSTVAHLVSRKILNPIERNLILYLGQDQDPRQRMNEEKNVLDLEVLI